MSHVTNMILSFSILEASGAEEHTYAVMAPINAWLVEQGYGAFGPDADTIAGGGKHLETPVYVAAFNDFRLDEFTAMLRGLPWKEPANVQVFVQDQDADIFTVHEPWIMPQGDTP